MVLGKLAVQVRIACGEQVTGVNRAGNRETLRRIDERVRVHAPGQIGAIGDGRRVRDDGIEIRIAVRVVRVNINETGQRIPIGEADPDKVLGGSPVLANYGGSDRTRPANKEQYFNREMIS